MVLAVSMEHSGTFNMNVTGEDQWRLFSSTQRVITQRPGFDWEARIAMLPGLPVHVHDAYIGGEGMLHASLFGLVSVANLRGTPEMAQGELLRWFAEGAWYPTALLPSQGVHWSAVDDRSATATMQDGATSVTLLFRFNADDMIASMRAEARGHDQRRDGSNPLGRPLEQLRAARWDARPARRRGGVDVSRRDKAVLAWRHHQHRI